MALLETGLLPSGLIVLNIDLTKFFVLSSVPWVFPFYVEFFLLDIHAPHGSNLPDPVD